MRWAAGVGGPALAILVVAALLFPGPAAARTPIPDDTLVIFCLDPGNAEDVAHAAVTLGLVAKADADDQVSTSRDPKSPTGRNLTIEKWRAADQANFLRACRAVAGVRELSSQPPTKEASDVWSVVWGFVQPVLLAFLGALLAWIFTELRMRGDAGSRIALATNTAARAYHRATTAYVNAWSADPFLGKPEAVTMGDRLNELDVELGRCKLARSRWKVPELLRDELNALDSAINAAAWNIPDRRETEAIPLRQRLDDYLKNVVVMTNDLERPWQLHRRMRADQLPHPMGAAP
ncbi:hypothetical protein Aple_070460 [Acrocarpospora pleiomorpha]|uniref:DUF5129 domain-containing protein n=1 Tax=Acrocarpospora pleiomorpha TaxID=90975 RepID=A0A5M3XS30_9ACTN|nr:hypothetical protein [Acrocarpospora pleiomorpha]GES24147.1 hypothetical protein Aple_070460 [Acrocarpospora pleiomorpha]